MSATSTGSERVKELDGLRALAILLVVGWHYLGTGDGAASSTWRAFIFGRVGVDLFFVLSGYLITSILLANATSPSYFSTFYARRSFRILPIYWLMLIIYLIGIHLRGSGPMLFGGPLPWWSYVIGLQNIWMAIDQNYGAAWLGGTWSLAIEEQFYLIFPLVIYLMSPRTLPRLLIALVLLCPVARIISYSLGDHLGYYVLMPLRADILAIGALIAWLEFSGSISSSVRRIFQIVFWTAACFFPVFAWYVELSDFNMAMWGHTYLVALFGSMVFLVLDRKGAPELAFLRSAPAAFFARISYALYLNHTNTLILAFLAAGYKDHTILTWPGAALTICAFPISVAICAASYRFIEGPLIRLAHRKFRYETPRKIGSDTLTAVSA
jgi:peptidoglycan/LPS O-acetylase OafA/YrhL